MSDFFAYAFKLIVHFIKPEIRALFGKNINEFDSLEDMMKLYGEGSNSFHSSLIDCIRENIPLETLKEILRTDGERHFNFPMPGVIKGRKMFDFLQQVQNKEYQLNIIPFIWFG